MASQPPQQQPPASDSAAQLSHGLRRIPSPGIKNRPMSSSEGHQASMMEISQRERLNNFIVNELQDSGCWDKPNAKVGDLSGPIHPLYRKKRWGKVLARDPGQAIGYGVPGNWSADNPRVWDALQPVLQLATKIISNIHLWPWLDALFEGQRVPIDEASMQDEPDLIGKTRLMGPSTFRRRSVLEQWTGTPMAQEMEQHLFDLSFHINLGFSDIKKTAGRLHGYHVPYFKAGENIAYHASEIYLCIWLVKPLLVANLSPSERVCQTFSCAKTLVHETMHASSWYIRSVRPDLDNIGVEPFFEDEAITELGRSWENSVFGGAIGGLPTDAGRVDYVAPYSAAVRVTWPSWLWFEDGKTSNKPPQRFRFPERFQKGAVSETWPIQIELLENLQQSAFWDVQVAALGSRVIAFPRIYGLSSEKGGVRKHVYGDDYARWISQSHHHAPEPAAPADASELAKWEVEQERRIRANAIAISQRNVRAEERAKLSEKNAQYFRLRTEHQKILNSALAQHDTNDWAPSLQIYQTLRTPFAVIAIQRNLAAWALKQAGYGPWAGELDRQLGAREFLKLEEKTRTQGNARLVREMKVLILLIVEILVKDRTLPATSKDGTEQEKRDAVMGVMQVLAQRDLDAGIGPSSSDLGWLGKAHAVQAGGGGSSAVAGPSGTQGLGLGQVQTQTNKRRADSHSFDDAPVNKKFISSSGPIPVVKPSPGSGGGANDDMMMENSGDEWSVSRWFSRALNLT